MKLTKREIFTILTEKLPHLTKTDIEKFLEITKYERKERKAILIDKNCTSKSAFLILKGSVRGYIISNEGIENNVLLRGEGYLVGDAGKLFNDEPQRYTYEAIQKTHVLFFDYADLEELANQNPSIMQWLLNIFKEIIIIQNYRIETFVSMTAEDRYKSLIKQDPNFLNKTHAKYIADFLGITPVSLSRIINTIKKNAVQSQ